MVGIPIGRAYLTGMSAQDVQRSRSTARPPETVRVGPEYVLYVRVVWPVPQLQLEPTPHLLISLVSQSVQATHHNHMPTGKIQLKGAPQSTVCKCGIDIKQALA